MDRSLHGHCGEAKQFNRTINNALKVSEYVLTRTRLWVTLLIYINIPVFPLFACAVTEKFGKVYTTKLKKGWLEQHTQYLIKSLTDLILDVWWLRILTFRVQNQNTSLSCKQCTCGGTLALTKCITQVRKHFMLYKGCHQYHLHHHLPPPSSSCLCSISRFFGPPPPSLWQLPNTKEVNKKSLCGIG